jgi:hypothetical protein
MPGNNCGHDPNTPRWFEPPKSHTRPKIISKAIAEIRRYYRAPAATIPSLNLANGSDRQQRSERREACLAVLSCLLHYLDLMTLRVGIPQADTSFQGISMPFIAEKSGLTLRRTERAAARQRKRNRKQEQKQAAKISLIADLIANQANVFEPADNSALSAIRHLKSILNGSGP